MIVHRIHGRMAARALAVWLVLTAGWCAPYARAATVVDPGTLTGKLIMGYQGWFGCPGDVTHGGWEHWFAGSWPTVDMLPDVSELAASETCRTPLRRADGSYVDVFSSYNAATVDRHFAWMQQYGIDGVAVERFATHLVKPFTLKRMDTVLGNVRRAAEAHGRVFYIMYDLSGMPPDKLSLVVQDWARLEQSGLTRSPAYLRHRGHPLLALWGLGFAGRKMTPHDAATLLDALTRASAASGGVTFMGGVPSYWLTRDHDASADPGWTQVWRRLGVISPWSVGRYHDDASANLYRTTVIAPDITAAKAMGVDYMPVVFPGFSWKNLMLFRNHAARVSGNAIPRRCGRFYWRQIYNARSAGATMIYNAMFDEVDEGTAMFKVLASAAQAPVAGMPRGDGFVTLDADGCHLPSDWYLRLAGAATSQLRAGTPPSTSLPFPIPTK